MNNIFIIYIPKGNYEAMVHYEDTIINKVSQERIFKYIDENLENQLRRIFGPKSIAIWGSRESSSNRARFSKMNPGDDILIIEGDTIKLLGKVAAKTVNIDLSKELWKNLHNSSSDPWELIYFIANPVEIDIPFDRFKELFNYSLEWQLRGFTNISEDKLVSFYSKYDDLYSILLKIKNGENIIQKDLLYDQLKTGEGVVNDRAEETYKIETKELSDHVRMQWKLLHLGLKTGAKVWVPKNDQSKIKKEYQYQDFESEFASGIDLDAKYVENIDVVWKDEFRIDAAFEIENTTSVYSGLLRFSDLKIVAPNSNYPLFIVAPTQKKNQVFEQVKRPTFKKIQFDKKVRYLSYEAVNEIDSFFDNSTTGLNTDLLKGKSEEIS